ncbi:hypothetical protein [Mesorhizobium sp.]|uniref:hypothetical protein n=1 Tax=Mesorhizobium sp. TaxID=1871066 RepID=UPI00257DFAC5|nr:hypothetical protein [Mesorhizobium sp.]
MDSRPFLHGDSTGHSLDNGAKLHDCAVPHQLDDAAPMFSDQRLYDSRSNGLIAVSVRASSVSIRREYATMSAAMIAASRRSALTTGIRAFLHSQQVSSNLRSFNDGQQSKQWQPSAKWFNDCS